jgi:hypothetical protein
MTKTIAMTLALFSFSTLVGDAKKTAATESSEKANGVKVHDTYLRGYQLAKTDAAQALDADGRVSMSVDQGVAKGPCHVTRGSPTDQAP